MSVTGVSLNTTSLTMTEGESQTLTATISPSNATDQSVTWASSNTTVATVSSSGIVSAKSLGTATITVKTNDGGKTATCQLTVLSNKVSVSGVSLDNTSLTMTEGETQSLKATVSPSNATDKSVTWSSNNESVAMVSSTGVVIARSAGTATITVQTTDGAKTATCTVTVTAKVISVTNLKVGLYHYLSTRSSGENQFENFNRSLKAHQWDLIPAVDIEGDGNDFSDLGRVRIILKDFLDSFYKEYGYLPVVYYGDVKGYRLKRTAKGCKSWFRTLSFSPLLPCRFQQVAVKSKFGGEIDLNYCKGLDYILSE